MISLITAVVPLFIQFKDFNFDLAVIKEARKILSYYNQTYFESKNFKGWCDAEMTWIVIKKVAPESDYHEGMNL